MNDNNSAGILVYPAFFKTIVEPGNNYRFQVSVKNNESSTITVTPGVNEFSQSDNNSNQLIISDNYDQLFSTAPVDIEPGETGTLNIDLSLKDMVIESSSFFPAISLSISEVSDSQVNIATEYVIPLYLSISGSYEESMDIQEFTSQNINLGKKVEFEIELLNDSNTYVEPTSYIEFHKINLANEEEKTRISTIPVVKGELTLLPESSIEETVEWNRDTFGKYEATLHVLSETKGLTSETTSFWVIPYESLTFFAGTALAVVLFFIALIGSMIQRKTKKSR